ncbi:MAG: response regulator [Okeania sp. SIO3B5]|uniref:response regulator n=1 Tax=Okeania sp. SIO3B5 TaxID=2607811 RepID=UPI0013FF22CE|nr:response regulator [Okeania sp. SIO3B5]NEO55613.1 response regulator [Okeania sp. SIO3B5]
MSEMAIICVDDELLILKSLEVELIEAFEDRYVYEFAETANEALEIIDELEEEGIKICVIVSDWLMPGVKGDELLMKVHSKYPQIIKILLTGQAEEESLNRVIKEANLYCCLTKPWNHGELVSTIENAQINTNRTYP